MSNERGQLFTRRSFMQTAAAGVPIGLIGVRLKPSESLEKLFAEIRNNLLQMINEERDLEKLPPVALDDLANRVATRHAQDMATAEFASHWGSDGLKPYQRYSFAGGSEATHENVSAADNTWSMKPEDLKLDTSYLHVRLYQEKPPNDGHRQAILAPQQHHVGIGFAVEKLRLRMVELFLARYVEVKSIKRQASLKDKIQFNGKLLHPSHILNSLEVFSEPLPKPPDIEWLRQPRSYSLPTESKRLMPVLPSPYLYLDRTRGVIEVNTSGSFSTPIPLFKNSPGIYTLVCWIKRTPGEKSFPGTQLSIRVE